MSIVYMSCSLLHAGFNVQNRLSNSQLSWFLAVCYSNPPFLWLVGLLTPPKSRRVLTRGADHVPILHEFGIFSALRLGLSDVPWWKEYCWVSLGEGEAETTLGSPKYRACSHSFHSWKTWSEKVQLCSAQFRSRTFQAQLSSAARFAMSEALQDLRHPPAGKVPRAAGAVEICRAGVHLGDDDLIAGYNGDVPSGKRLCNYGLRYL